MMEYRWKWLIVLLVYEFKTPCRNCGSLSRFTQKTGPIKQETEYCGQCHIYRGGYKHDGVFR